MLTKFYPKINQDENHIPHDSSKKIQIFVVDQSEDTACKILVNNSVDLRRTHAMRKARLF